MRSGVINFSSVWMLPVLLDTLGKKSQAWRQGEKRSLKRKACLNSQQVGSLIISFMMLSSLVKKVVDPEGSMCYRNPTDRQRALGFRVDLPWASQPRPEAPHTRCTKSSPHPVPHTPNLTAGHCELWCSRKRKPLHESLQVIAVTVASIFKRRKKRRRSLLPQPHRVWAHAGVVTEMQILQDTSFTGPDSPLFWLSLIYNHTGLLLPCLSQLKVGQPGDSIPPLWCRGEAELALMHTEMLQHSPTALVTMLRLQVGMAPPATAPSRQKLLLSV